MGLQRLVRSGMEVMALRPRPSTETRSTLMDAAHAHTRVLSLPLQTLASPHRLCANDLTREALTTHI